LVSAADILNARILIVDDQEINVLLLERMLRAAGHVAITSTTDPTEVCALYRKNRHDLILLDLRMPGMDGFQVMEALKETEPDNYLPLLVITARPDHKLRALQAGAKDFVSKPIEQAEVLLRVHNMLEVRLLHEAARDHGKMLESLALNDPLTGLANRRLLAERMSMALVGVHHHQPGAFAEAQGGGGGRRNRGAIAPAAVAELRRNAGLSIQQTGAGRDLRNKIPGPASRRVTNDDEDTDRGRLVRHPRRPFPLRAIV